ncbi:MAG: cytidylate kinase family protein [Clostridiales bacterium]|nr:cytidylate kinase family protein [Clostridiales bacterium]
MDNQATGSNNVLGEGKLGKLMLRFSIPCVLSLLVSALYNIVDQIFVGNSELSVLGNAATGVVFPIFIIAQAFAWWLGDGCAAYLNICQGRKNAQNAHKAIGTGIVMTVAASLVLMAVFYPLQKQILSTFGATADSVDAAGNFVPGSLDYAIEYFNIILGFFPVFMAMNMMNAVIRADGAPGWSMASMLSGAITNIVLDAAFIFGCGWGMAGAAWATVIGQTVSFAISVFYFIKKTKTFKMKLRSFIPDFKEFVSPVKLGLSSFITQLTIVIISLVCNIMLLKYGALSVFGQNIPISLIAVESKVFTVVINIVVGIVLGCQPIIGYNVGAKNYGRVKRLYLYILASTVAIGLIFTILFEAAPNAVVAIFGDPDPAQVDPARYWEFGKKLFRIFLMLVTFTCTIKMSSIFFQAAGKPLFAIIASLIRDIVCFIPLICTLPLYYGIEGILWAAPIADIVAMIVAAALTIVYFTSLNKAVKAGGSADESGAEVALPTEKGVIVTVAREHGSSGKLIAKLVAERLGLPYYYKDMIALAAKESGLDKEFISDVNADAPALLRSLYLSTEAVSQAVTAQDKAIKMIADAGSCVIVGRAADYVLKDYENVVRIFIYAPEEYKIKRITEVYGDSYEDAKKNVARSDAARAAYYKNISGRDWGDAKNYDLSVDGSIGVEACANVIYEFIKNRTAASENATDKEHDQDLAQEQDAVQVQEQSI